MAKAKKIVPITLDKKRNLWFNLNSLIIIERLTGVKFSQIGEDISLEMLRAMLFAGLQWEDADLDIQMVGEMIDFENMEEVMEKLSEAMSSLK